MDILNISVIFAPRLLQIVSKLRNYKDFGMKKTKVLIDVAKLTYAVELTRALAHPLRMKILQFIDREENINVNSIYRSLQLEQSITSHHLRILRKADVVSSTKDGKLMIYSINYDVVSKAVKAVNNYLGK